MRYFHTSVWLHYRSTIDRTESMICRLDQLTIPSTAVPIILETNSKIGLFFRALPSGHPYQYCPPPPPFSNSLFIHGVRSQVWHQDSLLQSYRRPLGLSLITNLRHSIHTFSIGHTWLYCTSSPGLIVIPIQTDTEKLGGGGGIKNKSRSDLLFRECRKDR